MCKKISKGLKKTKQKKKVCSFFFVWGFFFNKKVILLFVLFVIFFFSLKIRFMKMIQLCEFRVRVVKWLKQTHTHTHMDGTQSNYLINVSFEEIHAANFSLEVLK